MFAFTEKYVNFTGRILTVESILIGEDRLVTNIASQWDCGATKSSISSELVEELGLMPSGSEKMDSTVASEVTKLYDISYVLRDSDIIIPICVSEAKTLRKRGKIDLIIGMDILSKGDFAIFKDKGITYFSFRCPSIGAIDFTK